MIITALGRARDLDLMPSRLGCRELAELVPSTLMRQLHDQARERDGSVSARSGTAALIYRRGVRYGDWCLISTPRAAVQRVYAQTKVTAEGDVILYRTELYGTMDVVSEAGDDRYHWMPRSGREPGALVIGIYSSTLNSSLAMMSGLRKDLIEDAWHELCRPREDSADAGALLSATSGA